MIRRAEHGIVLDCVIKIKKKNCDKLGHITTGIKQKLLPQQFY